VERRRERDELVGWHGDVPLPISTVCAVLAGEAYIHGGDIARALGRPWLLNQDDMRTLFLGLAPLLPHYVDPAGAAGLTARFDIRLRGDPGARADFVFEQGQLTAREHEEARADCRISADPAAFVLIVYGRSGVLAPALEGKVFASGRKPWLGLTLPRRFRRP
jgi:hypothetical protein